MYVDVKSYLPIFQRLFDNKGVVAEYEYRDLQINPTIPEEEFTKGFKEYGF